MTGKSPGERDLEFENVIRTREELLEKWEAGWNCLFNVLKSITPEDFSRQVYIRNQAHTIPEAVNRQLGHYAYHVGQIVFLGKMLKGPAWQSLSIPRGKSAEFNRDKFTRGRHAGHFSDDTPR